jgi:hypothetical protein
MTDDSEFRAPQRCRAKSEGGTDADISLPILSENQLPISLPPVSSLH